MYEQHWGLQKTPFASDRNADSYFASGTHQNALLKLRFLVDHRRGTGLLVGASGSGKTRLLQALLPDDDPDSSPIVKLVYPQLSPAELLSFLISQLDSGQPANSSSSIDQLLSRLIHSLQSLTSQGRPAVIVIDDAQAISDRKVFESLHLLLNLQQPGLLEFTMILAGQPELVEIIRRIPQLDDRISIPCVLTSMTAVETAAYVQHRLQAAGASEVIFTRSALQAVHELSGGLPRRINRLCDFALLVGYAERLGLIDARHIEAVSGELNLLRAA